MSDELKRRECESSRPISAEDIKRRFACVEFFNLEGGTYWRPAGQPGSRRYGERGLAIASLGLKHSGGYEIILQFEDGKFESFNPQLLFPA